MSFTYNNSILVLTSPLSSVAALWCRGGGYKSYPMADAVIRASIQRFDRDKCTRSSGLVMIRLINSNIMPSRVQLRAVILQRIIVLDTFLLVSLGSEASKKLGKF